MPGRKTTAGSSSTPLVSLLGVVGVVCIVVSAVGLIRTTGLWPGADHAAAPPGRAVPDARGRRATVHAARELHPPAAAALAPEAAAPDYYPLEVGRYWVYVRDEPDAGVGVGVEVERRIVRRESGPNQDLYYFADGSMAFRQDGKVFEIGAQGGVNVVPVGAHGRRASYVYRSQGLHIEKIVGVQDTALVLHGRKYNGCVQVITRFRREDRADTLVYASYYAPGVGLVSREAQLGSGKMSPAETLRDYGPRQM